MGGAREGPGPARREIFYDRQQIVADAVARNPPIGVGRVVTKGLVAGEQVAPHLGATTLEQRADIWTATKPNAAEPAAAGAAQEPKQDGLGLVVERVTGRHARRVEPAPRLVKECVARVARRGFDRSVPGARERRDVNVRDFARELEAIGQRVDERLVGVGLGAAQAVVHVEDTGERKAEIRRNLAEQPHERDRVRPAGHGNRDAVVRSQRACDV